MSAALQRPDFTGGYNVERLPGRERWPVVQLGPLDGYNAAVTMWGVGQSLALTASYVPGGHWMAAYKRMADVAKRSPVWLLPHLSRHARAMAGHAHRETYQEIPSEREPGDREVVVACLVDLADQLRDHAQTEPRFAQVSLPRTTHELVGRDRR